MGHVQFVCADPGGDGLTVHRLCAIVQLEFGTWLGEMWERAATSFLPSVPRRTESAALFRSSPLGHRAPNRCVDRDCCRISVRGQSAALHEVNLVGVYSNYEWRKNRCRPALHAYALADDEGTVLSGALGGKAAHRCLCRRAGWTCAECVDRVKIPVSPYAPPLFSRWRMRAPFSR